jgi:hypothetical protein
VVRDILAFLQEPWDRRVLESGGRKEGPVDSDLLDPDGDFAASIPRWRTDVKDHELARIQGIAGELMAELGYELAPLGSAFASPGGGNGVR